MGVNSSAWEWKDTKVWPPKKNLMENLEINFSIRFQGVPHQVSGMQLMSQCGSGAPRCRCAKLPIGSMVLCLVGPISTNLVMLECFSTIHSEGSLVWTQSLIWRNKDYATWIHTPHAIVKFWRTSYSITSHTQYSHIIHISHSSLCSRSCHALTDVTQFVDLFLRGLINSKNWVHSDWRTGHAIYDFHLLSSLLYHWRFLLMLVFKSFRFPVISSCFMPFHSVM